MVHTPLLAFLAAVCILPTKAFDDQVIFADSHAPPGNQVKNVAIVGAGAGGSSAAYHLHKYARDAHISLNLTVFERNSYIGGRSTTVYAYDDPSQPVELGASIFVEVNHILVNAVREFELSTSRFKEVGDDIPGPGLGIWNGQEFVVTMARETGWWDYAKLFWRYGLAPVRTNKLMKSTVGNFLKLYDEFFPFSSLTKAVQDAGLLAVTSFTGEQYAQDNGIGMQFAYEVIQASTRVNYAQNMAFIHALEAMVCMATDGAMSVLGGNWQIFHNMVASTNGRTLINTDVSEVKRLPSGRWRVEAWRREDQEHGSSGFTSEEFDEVVIATPFQYSNLTIVGLETGPPENVPYVKLHVTLFTTAQLPSSHFFGLAEKDPVPHVVLTTLPPNEKPQNGSDGVGPAKFFSLSLLRPVVNPKSHQKEFLYKVFSAEPLSSHFLASLFGSEAEATDESKEESHLESLGFSWIYRKAWNSYPYEHPRVAFEKLELAPGLWYTSGIESFISTMETSALMGKNVARLVVDGWLNR